MRSLRILAPSSVQMQHARQAALAIHTLRKCWISLPLGSGKNRSRPFSMAMLGGVALLALLTVVACAAASICTNAGSGVDSMNALQLHCTLIFHVAF